MGLFERFRSRRKPVGDSAGNPLETELKNWRIVRASNEARGEQAIIRIRMSKPNRPDIGSLTTAVVVKWPYEGGAVPPAHVNQQQLEFERALDPLCTDGEAELVQVSTGMNLKEWIYYTPSSDIFMVRMNDLLSGHPRFPIQIEFFNDPKWQVWGDNMDSLKAKGV
jgi:hypothetical protein